MADNSSVTPTGESPEEASKRPVSKTVVLSSVAKAPPPEDAAPKAEPSAEPEKPKRLPPPLPSMTSTSDLPRPISTSIRPGGTTTVIKLPPKTGPLPQLTSLVPSDAPVPDGPKLAPPPIASPKAPKPADGKRPPPLKLGQTVPLAGDDSIFAPQPEPESPKEQAPAGWKRLEAGELPVSDGLQGIEFFSRTGKPAEEAGPFIATKADPASTPSAEVPATTKESKPADVTAKVDPPAFKPLPPPLPPPEVAKSPASEPEKPADKEPKPMRLAPPLTTEATGAGFLTGPLQAEPKRTETGPVRLPPPLPIAEAKSAAAPAPEPPKPETAKQPEAKPVRLPPPLPVQAPAVASTPVPAVQPSPVIESEPVATPAPVTKPEPIPPTETAAKIEAKPEAPPMPPPVAQTPVLTKPEAEPVLRRKRVIPLFLFPPAKRRALPPVDRSKVQPESSPTIKVEAAPAIDLRPAPVKPAGSGPRLPTRVPGAPAKAPGSTAAATPAAMAAPGKTGPSAPMTSIATAAAPEPVFTRKLEAPKRPTVVPGAPAKAPGSTAAATPAAFLKPPVTAPAPAPVSISTAPAAPVAPTLPAPAVPVALPVVAPVPAMEKLEPPAAVKLPPPLAPAKVDAVPAPTPVPAKTPAAPPELPAAAYVAPAIAAAAAGAIAEMKTAPAPVTPIAPVTAPPPLAKTSGKLELPERKILAKPKTDLAPKPDVPEAAITGPISTAADKKKTRSLTVKPRTPVNRPEPVPVKPAAGPLAATPQAARAARIRRKRIIELVVFWVIFVGGVLPGLYFEAFHFSQETRVEGQVVPPAGCTLGDEVWIVNDFTDQARGVADDLARDRAPRLQEIQEDEDHVQRAAADVSARDERVQLLQEQIQAAKDEITATIKQAHDAAQQVWDGPGAQLDAEYKDKLDALQKTIADRAASLHLQYNPDPAYASPEVWANAFRLALYQAPAGVDGTKEHDWLEDQMKAWRAFTKDVDAQETGLREQAAQIKMSPTSKVADLNSRIDDLQHQIDATITEAEPLKAELQQARSDLAAAQAAEAGLDEKYYRQLYSLPESVVITGGRLPLAPNGRFSWRHIEKDNAFAEDELEHHYWIFARAVRPDGRQFWSLDYLVVPKDHPKLITILPGSFVSTKAVLRPDLSPDEQAE
jgi:hypothetical protein